jgi:glutamyl-tRNA(Gln) amidotransferase subunit E
MYPETDIPPTQITEDHIKEINSRLPELPEQKMERVMKKYKLNEKLAKQILDSEHSELFETIIRESGVSPTMVAVFLTETLKSLKRDGLQVYKISDDHMLETFKAISSGKLMKESIPDVTVWLSKNEGKNVQDAISSLGLKSVSADELESLIDKIIADNKKLVQERGEGSFSVLMGIAMKDLRGKTDPSQVSRALREKLKEAAK